MGVLSEFDLAGASRPELPGVFSGTARIATVGIAVNRWIAYHGMTLNVGPYLELFAPYVSEYSRYLPRSSTTAATFWWTYIGSGGQFRQQSASYRLTAGDKVKNITASYNNSPGSGIDQLPGLGWFTVTGPIDNATREMIAPMIRHAALTQSFDEGWRALALCFIAAVLILPLIRPPTVE